MKNLFILIIVLTIVSSCKRNELIRTHGISYLENREKLIFVNKSNKNDARKILGEPSTRGMTDNNLWIYIERTITKGTLLKLGRNYVKKNNTLVLEFNKYGVLIKKDFFDKNKMQKVAFTKKITENDIKKENFIYSFLSSVRQKMLIKKK